MRKRVISKIKRTIKFDKKETPKKKKLNLSKFPKMVDCEESYSSYSTYDKFIFNKSSIEELLKSSEKFVSLEEYKFLDDIFKKEIIVPKSYELLRAIEIDSNGSILDCIFLDNYITINMDEINKEELLNFLSFEFMECQKSIIKLSKMMMSKKDVETKEYLIYLSRLVDLINSDINLIFSREELFVLSLVKKDKITSNFVFIEQKDNLNYFYSYNVSLVDGEVIETHKKFGLDISMLVQKRETSIKENPILSIIITTYNSAHLIEKALDSLNKNTVPIEVIVVDDCSSDNTISVIEEFSKNVNYELVIIKNETNIGPGLGRNKVLKLIRTPYFTILDADDYFKDTALDILYNHMSSNAYDMINFAHMYRNESKDTITPCKQIFNEFGVLRNDQKLFLSQNNLYSWGKLYKRDIIEDYNIKYSEGIYYEDAIFVINSFVNSKKILNLNNVLLVARVVETSATRTNFESGFHIKSYEQAILELSEISVEGLYKGKLEVVKELERRIPLYAKKDVPENYNLNVIRFNNAVKKLYRNWFGVTTYFTSQELNEIVPIDGIFDKKMISQHSKKVSSISTLYAAAEYFDKVGVRKDTILFLGFDFKYRGNSKYLFDSMLNNSEYMLKFVTRDKSVPPKYRVEPYSVEYFLYIAKSITIYCESYIDATFYIPNGTNMVQLWHGIPIKKMMLDSPEYYVKRKSPNTKDKVVQFTWFNEIYYVDSYHKKTMMSAFALKEDQMVQRQYPRVTYLQENNTPMLKEFIKYKLEIPSNKKVILYAPTWRDIWMEHPYRKEMLIDFRKINIPDDYIILVQQHPFLKVNSVFENKNLIYVKGNIETQDLIIASDICISDYSSIIFDFKDMNKEIFLLWKDKVEFEEYRGIYSEISEMFANNIFENELDLFDKIFK